MQSLFVESCISPLTAESGVRYVKGAEIGKINVVFISMNVYERLSCFFLSANIGYSSLICKELHRKILFLTRKRMMKTIKREY